MATTVSCVSGGGPGADLPDCGAPGDPITVEEAVGADTPQLRAAVESTLPATSERVTTRLLVHRRGDTTSVRVVRSDLPPAAIERLVDAVRSALPPMAEDSTAPPTAGAEQKTGGRMSGFVIVVESEGNEAEIGAARTRGCAPELLNRREIGNILRDASTQSGRTGVVIMWILVDEQGAPVRAQVSRSSGDEIIDALGMTVGYAARFTPATSEGLPVRVWVQIPVELR